MRLDPLHDIVRSLELQGAVFLDARFGAPWAITSHVTEEDCRPFLPIPKQLIAFHAIVEGQMMLSMKADGDYEESYRLAAGDIVFLPRNPVHVLASSPSLELLCADDLVLPPNETGLAHIQFDGGGEPARILCGFIASDAGATPLLDGLPEALILSVDSFAKQQWIEASMTMAAQDLVRGRVADAGSVSMLSELLLTEALRTYVEQNERPGGWLAAMSDPRLSRALMVIHSRLADPPSVERLASEVGMSRSSFVASFKDVMRISPKRYMLDLRMSLAAQLLTEGRVAIAEVSARTGYTAPEAFSRAFKKERGMSPAEWRERRLSVEP